MNNRQAFSFLAQAMLFSTLTHSDLTGEPPVETEEQRLARLRELDRLEQERESRRERRYITIPASLLEMDTSKLDYVSELLNVEKPELERLRIQHRRSSAPEQPPIVCAEHKWKFVRDKGGPYKRRCVICRLEAVLPEAPETRQQKRMKRRRKSNQ